MILRDYQIEAINSLKSELQSSPNALLVLATGLGKTETIFGFCLDFLSQKPDAKILFLVNKVTLVQQTKKRAEKLFDVGVFCGTENSHDVSKPFVVASIQSIKDFESYWDLIILDETHRAEADSYSDFISMARRNNENLKVVGLTATPFNSKGYIYGPDSLYPKITFELGLKWAIDNGWLVKPVLKHNDQAFDTSKLHTKLGDYDQSEVKEMTVNRSKVETQIADAIPKLEGRKKVIWHCSCIEHAELVSSLIPNERSVVIHSRMNKLSRKKALEEFESGQCRHLVFVMIVSEGYDFPPIDAVVLMRPTKSPIVYVQSIGRALRTSEGKTNCLVLDYGQVVRRCGPLDNPNVSSGNGRSKDYLKTGMKFCPSCYTYQDSENAVCQECSFDFVKAKIEAQKDRLKSLTRHSDDGSEILSKEKSEGEFMEIDPSLCRASVYQAKSGNWCIKISFRSPDFSMPIVNKFIPVMEGFWVKKFVNEQVSKLICEKYYGFDGNNLQKICDDINAKGFAGIRGVKVEKNGRYLNVKGYVYNEPNSKEEVKIC